MSRGRTFPPYRTIESERFFLRASCEGWLRTWTVLLAHWWSPSQSIDWYRIVDRWKWTWAGTVRQQACWVDPFPSGSSPSSGWEHSEWSVEQRLGSTGLPGSAVSSSRRSCGRTNRHIGCLAGTVPFDRFECRSMSRCPTGSRWGIAETALSRSIVEAIFLWYARCTRRLLQTESLERSGDYGGDEKTWFWRLFQSLAIAFCSMRNSFWNSFERVPIDITSRWKNNYNHVTNIQILSKKIKKKIKKIKKLKKLKLINNLQTRISLTNA